MSKKRTLPENIRRYKQEYIRLGVQEAKLNQQLFKMKKRIKLLAEEEELRLSEKALLSELLQKIHEQKLDLESQEPSKKRDTQLKRVIKEYKQVKAKHSRNQYQLDTLEVKKDKDNVVKLLLKEAKLEDVRFRLQSTYETWMYLEQMQQYETTLMQSLMETTETPVTTIKARQSDFCPFVPVDINSSKPRPIQASHSQLSSEATVAFGTERREHAYRSHTVTLQVVGTRR